MKTEMNSVKRRIRNEATVFCHESLRFVAPLLLAALACVLVSCTSIDAHTTQYAGAPHPPPSAPDKVEILRAEPTRPHDRLGEVMVDASTDPAPPIEHVEA